MRRLLCVIGIVILSHSAGCALLRTSSPSPDQEIDGWLTQHEYGNASAVVGSLKDQEPGRREALQARIAAHMAAYEQQAVADAEKAAARNEWGAAFDLYRDALSHLPESTRLQQGQQQLLQRRAEHLEKLELERLIAKGEWTLKDLEVSRLTAADNSGDWFERYSLSRKAGAANALALDLAAHGRRALDRKDLALAKRIVPLALNLSSTAETRDLHARLQDALREEKAHMRAVAQPRKDEPGESRIEPERPVAAGQDQKRTKHLMADFRAACQDKKFLEAQQLMVQMEKQGVEGPEFERLKKQLARDIARHVKRLIDAGATHYSRQRYAEALSVWQEAQALDPKNEQLAARIKRVTRVLENLQNLRIKNSAAP